MVTPAALTLHQVSVDYGTTRALDSVSLAVEAGEVLALVGPSGSGKSTLLRAVAGLEPVADGEIAVGGRSMVGVPVYERGLGLMFQDHALLPHLNVAANVAFGLKTSRTRRWAKPEQAKRVAELLALVGLDALADRRIEELSGGEAQRVALARSLAPMPQLLLLDEPFGSLDPILRHALTIELRELLADLGQTAVHVTHDLAEAFAVADRVAILRNGRLEQVATPEELWRQPVNRFVAEFVGHRNHWPVTAARHEELGLPDDWLGTEIVFPVRAVVAEVLPNGAETPAPAVPGTAAPAPGPGETAPDEAALDEAVPGETAPGEAVLGVQSDVITLEASVVSARWSDGRYWLVATAPGLDRIDVECGHACTPGSRLRLTVRHRDVIVIPPTSDR